MSKEQTPITSYEFLELNYYYELNDFENLEINKTIISIMEQYAQAKVLEALEMHIVGFVIHSANEDLSEDDKGYNEFVNLVKNYIETEVKPKYEN